MYSNSRVSPTSGCLLLESTLALSPLNFVDDICLSRVSYESFSVMPVTWAMSSGGASSTRWKLRVASAASSEECSKCWWTKSSSEFSDSSLSFFSMISLSSSSILSAPTSSPSCCLGSSASLKPPAKHYLMSSLSSSASASFSGATSLGSSSCGSSSLGSGRATVSASLASICSILSFLSYCFTCRSARRLLCSASSNCLSRSCLWRISSIICNVSFWLASAAAAISFRSRSSLTLGESGRSRTA